MPLCGYEPSLKPDAALQTIAAWSYRVGTLLSALGRVRPRRCRRRRKRLIIYRELAASEPAAYRPESRPGPEQPRRRGLGRVGDIGAALEADVEAIGFCPGAGRQRARSVPPRPRQGPEQPRHCGFYEAGDSRAGALEAGLVRRSACTGSWPPASPQRTARTSPRP